MKFTYFWVKPNIKYKGVFRTQSNIYDGAFLRLQKGSIVDVRLSSKYALNYLVSETKP